ncbi:MAG: endonuclease/exonuclease/phosphatase family protein [Thermoguttaceae bacterium]|nr:endonuclease/exonuclease/phosphatase family protein [Thermoguttaceae bacterium]
MKLAKYFGVFVAFICAFSVFNNVSNADDEKIEFRVMSFNIRCANGGDGENNWEFRCDTLLDVVRESDPLLLGVQEAVPAQMDFLKEKLADYQAIGVGRDDGDKKGEFMAIFFKKDMLELLDSGTFWLSKTPDTPSKGWDAQCFRTVTWAKFRCKKTGKTFCYANTHLDHVGTIARKEGAKLILRRMNEIADGQDPFFVSGDFNVTDQSEAYATITAGVDDIPGLRDCNKVAEEREAAQEYTFHNWGKVPPEQGAIIDFIFVNDKVEVKKFKINPLKHSDGRYASDHVSIVATLSF